MEIRTKKQMERAASDAVVAKAYKSLQQEHPEAKPTRLMSALVENGSVPYKSVLGLKNCLRRAQVL